ncbi:MAG: UvrD-helicase domain-containing protein [Anaerolineae bacterium]|nr:UvrD-helicase domain-containing protein [Anaerolineae bacterium]
MNPQQKAAVTADDGPVLILAGPGSGKTRVLTSRIAYLIRLRRVPPQRIMAVTFTNKATDEMRSRLERMLGDDLDDMQIGTFHRISMRLLRREAERLGYRPNWKILSTNKQYWIIRRILERFAGKDASFSPTDVRKAISLAKNRIILPEMYEETDEFSETVRKVHQVYQAELLEENLMDVDDLLLQLVILLLEFPAVRKMFQQEFEYLLIDEFQDTNLVQYEIVKALAPPQNNIYVVGDEDQSVYAFRGANHHNLQRLRSDFPGLAQILLEQNYRSTQTILDAARAVISHNPHRTPKALFSKKGVGDRIQVYEASSDLDEAEYAQEQIEFLRDSKRLRYGDFAIMYRKNSQSLPFKSVFHLHDVPFRVVNTIDFDQRREVKDIMAMMHLARDSDFEEYFRRLAEIKTLGISKSGMRRFLDWLASDELNLFEALNKVETGDSPLNRRQAKAFAGFSDALKSWRESAVRGHLVNLFDQIIQYADYHQHLERICKEGWELAERRDSVKKLRRLASAASLSSDPFERFGRMVALDKGDVDDEPDKVALTTLHSAKGLEFPVVFIIGLNENVLPHVHESDGPNDVTEERRLFYVGLTRAESRIFLTYTSHKGLSDVLKAPSEFLSELPDHLLDAH